MVAIITLPISQNANGEKHLDFWGARQACQDMGADLPIIDNSLTNFRILTEAMAIDGDSDTWSGIKEVSKFLAVTIIKIEALSVCDRQTGSTYYMK